MPDFLASSGPVDVLASGTVITFEGNPIEILFDALATPLVMTSARQPQLPAFQAVAPFAGRFKLVFRFVDEAPTTPNQPLPTRIETTRMDEEDLALVVTLFNFTSPIGTGTSKPLQFAYAAGRNLSLHYRVWAVGGSTDKTLQFTIYQSKTQDHKEEKEADEHQSEAEPSEKGSNA